MNGLVYSFRDFWIIFIVQCSHLMIFMKGENKQKMIFLDWNTPHNLVRRRTQCSSWVKRSYTKSEPWKAHLSRRGMKCGPLSLVGKCGSKTDCFPFIIHKQPSTIHVLLRSVFWLVFVVCFFSSIVIVFYFDPRKHWVSCDQVSELYIWFREIWLHETWTLQIVPCPFLLE